MEQFKIRKDGFKEIRRETLFYLIPIMLIASLGIILFYYFKNGGELAIGDFLFVSILLGILIFGVHRSLNMQKAFFENYRLTIDDSAITREQYNTPTIIIPIADISEIHKNSNRSFTIKGSSSINEINIPSQVENYEKVEQLLSEIKPISHHKKNIYIQILYMGLITILMLGLMGAVYLVEDKIIVGICGTILLIIMGYSIFIIQRSKNFDRKTKRGVWVSILLIVSIIIVMFYKIFG